MGLGYQLPTDHPYAEIDFSIDENGSLRTTREFDYESDDHNYSVRIWATDEHNATTHDDFVLTLTNVVEDLDGDGTEDYYDDDIDGDGLTNAEELLQFRPMGCKLRQPPTQRYQCQQLYHRRELSNRYGNWRF